MRKRRNAGIRLSHSVAASGHSRQGEGAQPGTKAEGVGSDSRTPSYRSGKRNFVADVVASSFNGKPKAPAWRWSYPCHVRGCSAFGLPLNDRGTICIPPHGSEYLTMIHGYHVILPMYGFWLPNDPRGSWSDFVRRWELVRFGTATKSIDRRELTELSASELQQRAAAKRALKYPPVSINGRQALAIARGFADQVRKSNYTIWECSILPEHTHLVIARHTYKVEQIVNLLKGAATSQILKEGRHPLAAHAQPGHRPPRMWAAREWKVFLDTEEAIEDAIRYVQDNPEKEAKRKQHWPFVTPFAGIPRGGWTTYH